MLSSSAETYSVSELGEEIRQFLGEAFSRLWVAGEIQRLRMSRRGHLYFELVEKGEEDEIVGKLDAVLWRTTYRKVSTDLAASGQELAEGQQIRCRVGVDFYPPGGRLQLVVQEVDPIFTLGLLAQRRRQTLEALAASGLLETNKALPLAEVPLQLALITSEDSAAYHDFLSTLRESGYGFRVLFMHAAVQGREAEREVVSALETLVDQAVDCAVLIRGGGSRSDLAVFDSRAITEAVARAPFPVLTGLGHEIDESITDLVAHLALKTPTKVAEFLVERVASAEAAVLELQRSLCREAREPLQRSREALGGAQRGLQLARLRLEATLTRIQESGRTLCRIGSRVLRDSLGRSTELQQRVLGAAARRLSFRRQEPDRLGRRLVTAAQASLREIRASLTGHARVLTELAPQRTLERGFSITRDRRGAILTSPEQVAPGEQIQTQLASGELLSRVESS